MSEIFQITCLRLKKNSCHKIRKSISFSVNQRIDSKKALSLSITLTLMIKQRFHANDFVTVGEEEMARKVRSYLSVLSMYLRIIFLNVWKSWSLLFKMSMT